MSNVPAGGFKMGHKGANKSGVRKPRKPIKKSAPTVRKRDASAIAAFHAVSLNVDLLDRETLIALYLRCVETLAAWPEEEP